MMFSDESRFVMEASILGMFRWMTQMREMPVGSISTLGKLTELWMLPNFR